MLWSETPRKPIEINDTRLENISEISLLSRESLRKNERVADKIQNPVKVRVERRRCRRYPFVASVELVDLESALQLQERVTDLSLYGCGVTASKPLPVGIKLRVRITSKGSTFSAPGKVAYATSNGDMGIVFAQIEPNDQMILEKWISDLRDR